MSALLLWGCAATSMAQVAPPPESVCAANGAPPIATGTRPSTPGIWWNPLRSGTGWTLNYANNGQDLSLAWFTYDSSGKPIWLLGDNATINSVSRTWQAPLRKYTWNYTTNSTSSQIVGSVALRFINNEPTRAALAWQWNEAGASQYNECIGDFYQGGTREVQRNANATFTGAWYEPMFGGYGDLISIGLAADSTPSTYVESHSLTVFDAQGAPVWFLGASDRTLTAPPENAARTIALDMYRAGSGYPAGVPINNCSHNCTTRIPGVGQVTRTFTSPTTATANFSINVGAEHLGGVALNWSRPANGLGTVNWQKIADADGIAVDRLSCQVRPDQTSCGITVNWSAVSSAARAFRRDLVSGVATMLADGASGQFTHRGERIDTLTAGQRVQYELYAGASTATALLFRSPEVRATAVTPATPPTPDPSTTPPVIPASSESVGAVAATFRVDESGAATYRVPLYAPPGRGGVTPEIALTYSSAGGDGPLGAGWGISGTSSIGRCRKTREAGDADSYLFDQVNFRANDQFCLDGQRLIQINAANIAHGATGAEYRTEIDSFQRVVVESHTVVNVGNAGNVNVPSVLLVFGKDGTVRRYGESARNGQVLVQAFTQVLPLAWNLTESRDSNGNRVTFDYLRINAIEFDGDYFLSAINYVGGRIAFVPEQRANAAVDTVYVGGATVRRSRRVQRIDVSVQNDVAGSSYTVLRSYNMTYQTFLANSNRERLFRIRECRDSTCLAPTTLFWSDFAPASVQSTSAGSGFGNLTSFKYGDFDGDGRSDMLWIDTPSGSNDPYRLRVSMSTPTSSGLQFAHGSAPVVYLPRAVSDDRGWQVLDFNGDGRDDLLYADGSGIGGFWRVRLSIATTSGSAGVPVDPNAIFSPSFVTDLTVSSATASISVGSSKTDSYLSDLDGDGLADLITVAEFGGQYQLNVRYLRIRDDTDPLKPTIPYGFTESTGITLTTVDGGFCGAVTFSKFNVERFEAFDANGDGLADLRLKTFQQNCPLSLNDSYNYITSAEALELYPKKDQPNAIEPIAHWRVFLNEGNIGSAHRFRGGATRWQISGSGETVADDEEDFRVIDINADGLADVAFRKSSREEWMYQLNLGLGSSYAPPACVKPNPSYSGFNPLTDPGACLDSPHQDKLQFLDFDGDGRVDYWEPMFDVNRTYAVYTWHGRGFATTGIASGYAAYAGNDWLRSFADLDGDGHLDNLLIKPRNSSGDSAGDWAARRTDTHHLVRNVVYYIVNGLGASTNIDYAPLTFSSVYRRDYIGPYQKYARGSPVFDIAAPGYVVRYVSSSAPTENNPGATSMIRYEYRGMKMQAGGRGSLGFRKIITTDLQNLLRTETTYRAFFPLIGTPFNTNTVKLAAVPSETCASGSVDNNTCFVRAPECATRNSVCDVAPTGSTLVSGGGDNWRWQFSTRQTPGETLALNPPLAGVAPRPLFIFKLSSSSQFFDLGTGTVAAGTRTHTEFTTFNAYDDYGNVLDTDSGKYDEFGGQSVTVKSLFTYDNNISANPLGAKAQWHLGRLRSSTITHTRAVDGQNPSTTRVSTFDYDANTGQLMAEHLQPAGALSQQLHTYYSYDSYGNKIKTATCSGHFSEATCRATAAANMAFRPDPAQVQRYARQEYDPLGRFVLRSYAPFFNGASSGNQAVERLVSNVLSYDGYGNVLQVADANGVVSYRAYGVLGRSYWEKHPSGATKTSYRATCGAVPCPSDARYRVEELTAGAPAAWMYYDVLERPVLAVRQGFEFNEFIAARTVYDNTGRLAKASEPYFTYSPTSASVGAPANSALFWTYTEYDALGRVRRVTRPDNSVVTTQYNGLTTVATLPTNGSGQTQSASVKKNAMGEVEQTTDARGWVVSYLYRPTGELWKLRRSIAGTQYETVMSYDDLGRKIAMTDPDMGSWTYEVNAAGETYRQIGARGTCTYSQYDAQGRMWRRTDYANNSCTGAPTHEARWNHDTAGFGIGGLADEAQYENGANTLSRVYQYDSLSRPTRIDTVQDGRSYVQRSTFDQFGRAFQSFFKSSNDNLYEVGEQQFYNAQGYQNAIRDAFPGDTGVLLYRVLQTNARGQVLREEHAGNAVLTTQRVYDTATGRLTRITTDNGRLQSLNYVYDFLGNVTQRTDQTNGAFVRDTFQYDNLQRLTSMSTVDGFGQSTSVQTMTYDGNGMGPGNITGKSGIGNYTYRSKPLACNALDEVLPGPHAASETSGNTQSCYDANGNHTRQFTNTGLRRQIIYTPFDLPHRMLGHTLNKKVEFYYGPNRERIRRLDFDGVNSVSARETTHFVGNAEIHRYNTGKLEVRRYVGAATIVLSRDTQGLVRTEHRYVLTDNLGSTHRVVAGTGDVVAGGEMSFDPWGARRQALSGAAMDLIAQLSFDTSGTTRHGYTGHEQVDPLGIIHMRGRIYDPNLGRFLQADPMVQDPFNGQSLNRYTYVFNNPLAYTDPTGYWGRKEQMWLRTAVAIVVSIWLPGSQGLLATQFGVSNALAQVAITGFVSGAVQTGTLRGAVTGAFSAMVFYGVGSAFPNYGAAKVLAHGIAGGIMSELQGGKFGHGFISAGVSEALSPAVDLAGGDVVGEVVIHAVIGGTSSALSGGKFANGAVTAAFGRVFAEVRDVAMSGDAQGSGDVNENTALSVRREVVTTREVWGLGYIDAHKTVGAEMAAFAQDGGPELCVAACPIERVGPLGLLENGFRFKIQTINSHVACANTMDCGNLTPVRSLHVHGAKRYRVSRLDARLNGNLQGKVGKYSNQDVDNFSVDDKIHGSNMLYSPKFGLRLWDKTTKSVTDYGH
jgi:RHS repeat-associated protein